MNTQESSPERGVSRRGVSRRGVLRGVAGTATATIAFSTAGSATSQEVSEPAYGGWFDNVSNYEKTLDMTGKKEVTITVGASGNMGHFAFAPPAVRIDPGTTVIWEWSGKGGVHNVAAEDGSFTSELTGVAGHTFEQTFEEPAVVKYACQPHKMLGMKGALVVGAPSESDATNSNVGIPELLTIGGGLGLAGVLLGMFALGFRANAQQSTNHSNR